MAAANDPVEFTTATGRLVWGSVHKAKLQTEDDGKTPKKIKSGENIGEDLYQYQFGVAIPKTPGVTHWASEAGWGEKIWATGHAAWPAGQAQRHDFAWKVTDGDSTVPNKNGKAPNQQNGYPGCWILSFSNIQAPEIWSSAEGAPKPSAVPNLVHLGDEVQVIAEVKGNDSLKTAGVFFNPKAVCWRGQSAKGRISSSAPVDGSKFGAGLAPGASYVAPSLENPTAPPATPPVPNSAPPVPGAPAPTAPPVPGASVTPSASYTPNGTVPPVPGTVPQPPAPPTPPAPPVAPPADPQVTAKMTAEGQTYATMIGAGWNDQQLREHGYIV